jgi:hypothetical protein
MIVALKEKNLLRANQPQKVLVVERLLYPMCRVPTSGTVLTAASDQ